MFSVGCAGAFEEKGPMWSFVDPVTNQVEVHICALHKNSRFETYLEPQNTNVFFFCFFQVSFETSQEL